MRLIRFGFDNMEKPGIELADGGRLDVSGFGQDYDEVFFETDGINRLKEWLAVNSTKCPRVSNGMRLGPPLCRPSKIVCVGLNYSKHAEESGMEIPREPVLF